MYCPKCGARVDALNELSSWECARCGKGAYVFQCPNCHMWIVHEYENKLPPVFECQACGTFVSP